ncbi:MAG: BatA domain-containing protein [Vicinamibacterales bacterium]
MIAFLSPLFLAGALAAAVPLVLHLLKREPEPRVKFSAVRLLRRAPVEDTERHRLRDLLLLALRVATLVFLALAFARPFFVSGAASVSTGATIVALDTSYSLSAPGRFDRAKALAKDAITRASIGDAVGVITFSDEAEIVAKPSADRVLAAAAIDEAVTGFGATRYRAALAAAAQALAGRRGTIVVVTDLQETGWDAGDRVSVPEGARIEIADVGPPPADLAVTAVRPMADRVVAMLRNTGTRVRDAHAHLSVDGRPAGDATASLGPQQSAEVTFAGAPRGAAAAVTVDDPDGIQADNVRFAVLAGASRPSVLVVTGSGDLGREAFYVQHALTASGPGQGGQGGASSLDVAALGAAQLSTMAADALAPRAAVLLLSTRGLERRGREALAAYVHGGGGLFIAAGPDIDGEVASGVLGDGSTLRMVTVGGTRSAPRTLAPADVRHPVFRPFAATSATLGLVTFQNAARIDGSGCQTLARFTTGDRALLECPAGDGRALVLASDLDNKWNDFPLHASFVPFLHEAVRYLASARAQASEYYVGDTPAGVPRTPGVHAVPVGAGPAGGGTAAAPRRIAVNVDPREADPARVSAEDFQSAVTRLKDVGRVEARAEAREQEDQQHLWQYALALMIITLTIEGAIASRTA